MRAAVEGGPSPEPKPAPPKPGDLTPALGRYVARHGETLGVAAHEAGIAVTRGGRRLIMSPGAPGAFSAVDPAETPLRLVFRRKGKAVVRAWWGETEYVREGVAFSPPTPPALRSLTGYYENDDVWRGSFRILAQGEALFVDGTTPLVAIGPGLFRAGDDAWSPERMRFDAVIDGRPQRAVASGADFLRRPA